MQRWERQQARDKAKTTPAEPLYIALEDFDLSFFPGEVKEAKELWKQGLSIPAMAEQMEREVEEVFILLYDLATKGKIKNRPNGLFGAVKE